MTGERSRIEAEIVKKDVVIDALVSETYGATEDKRRYIKNASRGTV